LRTLRRLVVIVELLQGLADFGNTIVGYMVNDQMTQEPQRETYFVFAAPKVRADKLRAMEPVNIALRDLEFDRRFLRTEPALLNRRAQVPGRRANVAESTSGKVVPMFD
jgi:hypothetical protein